MKKIIPITLALILCSVCFVTYKFYDVSNIEETPIKNMKQNNMLSMMLENSAGSGQYEMTTSSSWPIDGYVFNSELSKCENGSVLSWDDTNKQVVFSGNITDKCYVYFDVYNPTLIEYVISRYTGTQGENGLYYHDGTIKDTDGNIIDAEDNSYRYAGANPNNYVCFGSDDATCPTENLYRIIGLIDGKIKLISADGATTDMLGTDGGYSNTASSAGIPSNYYKGSTDFSKIGVYYWNSEGSSTWSDSTTNLTNLNTNYLTYLDEKNTKWKEMIDDTIWFVGGVSYSYGNRSNAKTVYDYEVGTNKEASVTVTAKIGLIYLSDYYYGALPEYWVLPGYDYDYSNNDYQKAIYYNWVNVGLLEWTISPVSEEADLVFRVYQNGQVAYTLADSSFVLQPSFNLTSSVQYDHGTGTASDPIRLKI